MEMAKGEQVLEIDWRQLILGALIEIPVWRFFDFLISYLFSLSFSVLPSVNLSNLVSLVISLAVVVATLMVISARQTPIVGVTAYLFFPKATADQDRTLPYHKDHHYRGTFVNFKTIPPSAYYLTPKSYAWTLIEKHPELWVREWDDDPSDPDYVKKWCEARKFSFAPRVPSRNDLLRMETFNIVTDLDPALEHVEYRFFCPYYNRSLGKSGGVPPRRCVLNWSTMKAFPCDFWTMKLVVAGKIRGTSVIWIPIPHYVQRWTKSRGFEWSDRLPTMRDFLAKGTG
jgi:hypothetical protein